MVVTFGTQYRQYALCRRSGVFGLYIGFSTVRDLKTKEKSVEGWAFYALLTVAVAAAFLGILLRNVSYTVS